jgi:hypothetical protein
MDDVTKYVGKSLKIRDNIDFDTIAQDNQKLKAKTASLKNEIKSIQETLSFVFQ